MFSAPPELTIEKAWIHAAEGSEVELVCTLQSDMSTDVINFILAWFYYSGFAVKKINHKSLSIQNFKLFPPSTFIHT